MREDLQKKVDRAIKLIQSAAKIAKSHGQPLELCYSGGKDSDVILELAKMSGVEYRAIHKVTTIDPAGTIKHAKENGCEIVTPKQNFLSLLASHGMPSRRNRFCCKHLKEYKILDYAILGIRAEESNSRKERYKEPTQCRLYRKCESVEQYFPILSWTKQDVLDFINERNIKLHPLYYKANGEIDISKRLGCMACPMASYKQRLNAFKEHPNMVKLYVRGGGKYLENHPNSKMNRLCKDAYQFFCFDIICQRSNARFKEKFGPTLFDDGADCKEYLERYFNIKF